MAATEKVFANGFAPSCADVDLNGYKNENNNLIEGSGQLLNIADSQQTNKAVTAYAMVAQFVQGGGIADAYTLTAVSPRIAPPALIDGMVFRAIFGANNTGASTVNPFGIGVIDIKLPGGITDPSAGQIKNGREVTLIHRISPGVHAELVDHASVKITVVTVSDASFTPDPLTKSIEFTVTGGGGGAGGVDGQGVGTAAVSSGGAAAGTSILLTSVIDSTYNITIGAKGTGGDGSGGNDGTTGGTSSVVSTSVNMSAIGGIFGKGMVGTASNATATGAQGGTSTGGDYDLKGGGANPAFVAGGLISGTSSPGGSYFGGGELSGISSAGLDAVTFGVGGGATGAGAVATDFDGGDGGAGVVIVKEFF